MSSAFNPEDYFRVAEELAKAALDDVHKDEAKLRVAVGRAYYSVFLQACVKTNIRPGDDDKHAKARDALSRKNLVAGGMLKSLFSLRVQADYYLKIEDRSYEDWEENWDNAKDYANKIAVFLNS